MTGSQFFHIAPACSAHARLGEAEHYFLQGNLDEALAAAQQAWREHPLEPEVFRVLAYLHMSRNEYPPAEQAARRAMQLDSENAASAATLAQVYLTFNVQQLARQTLTAAQQQFPDDAALLALSADLNFRLHLDTEGEAQALRALQYNPQDGYARALLGAHYMRRQRYARAAEFLAGAVEAYPLRWDYLRDLGVALLHERHYREAGTLLIRAWQLHPQEAPLSQYLCYALHLDDSPASLFWQNSFFFYRHRSLGVLLHVFGYLAGFSGFLWLLAQMTTHAYDALRWSMLCLCAGLVSLYISFPGIRMHERKGPFFERTLHRAMEKAQARWQMATGKTEGEHV